MAESFDAYQYARHLRGRWRLIAAACATALAVTLTVTLLLPKKYTATCKILIESPATGDPRAATVVSPVYLESLKTYEHFAASDSLFRRALNHFQLRKREADESVEARKRSILKVAILRSTKVLEISATLPDARTAHALALYLAEETVKLNRAISLGGDQELSADLEKQLAQARDRLAAVQSDWNRMAASQPVESVAAEIRAAEDMQGVVQRELLQAEMLIAEDTEREKALASSAGRHTAELEAVRQGLPGLRTRAEMLRKQRDELQREIARKQALLAERTARKEELAARLRGARAGYDASEARLRELGAMLGQRSERLRIIDPGIVPERPSFPNLPLNLLAAFLLGLVSSVLYVTLEFSFRGQQVQPGRPALRIASTGSDV